MELIGSGGLLTGFRPLLKQEECFAGKLILRCLNSMIETIARLSPLNRILMPSGSK